MSRRLILMRHAKSSWSSGAATDHARPLNKRGRRDSPRIGTELNSLGWIPQAVISSDSERTQETWARMEPTLESGVDPIFTRDLYHGGFSDIAAACAALEDDVACAMVLGHNPGWEDTASALCDEQITMTTANCVLLEADGSWADLMEYGAWRLVDVLRPRELS